MKKRLAVILSLFLALEAASPAFAAELTKNNVDNIAAREEQAAIDYVTGPAAGEQQAAEEQRQREQEMLEAARRERELQSAKTEARLEEERKAREERGELPPDWLENSQYKNLAKMLKKPK